LYLLFRHSNDKPTPEALSSAPSLFALRPAKYVGHHFYVRPLDIVPLPMPQLRTASHVN